MTEISHIAYIRRSLATIPVAQLDLPPRAKRAFMRARIKSALDVQKLIETNSLTDVNRIGPATAVEIKECMNALLESKGFDLSSSEVGSLTDTVVDSRMIPDILFDDLPIDVLAEELGDDLLERLKRARFERFGELAALAQLVATFIQNADSSLDRLISYQKKVLQGKIDDGRLHRRVKYHGARITAWINRAPQETEQQLELLSLLTRANEVNSLTGELSLLFAKLPERDIEIYVKYFGSDASLQQIGKEIGITRERVRQITSAVATKLWNQINHRPSLYLQSALLLAKDMGNQLSRESWKRLLQDRELINSSEISGNIDPFTALCALLHGGDKAKHPPSIEIDKSLVDVLNNPGDLSLGSIKAIEDMPPKAKRRVRRIIKYVGGIHLTQATDILRVTPQQAEDILEHFGYREVIHGWYTIAAADFSSQPRWPILKAGLAMMEACGPIEFNRFCDGIRKYISRFYDVIAPPKVMKAHLEALGFELEEDFVCWPETPQGYLAESDKCFIRAIERFGRVVTFQEVVEFFQEEEFSIETATTRVLPQSPIVERVDSGLYKLRGQSHTWEDIVSAKGRQETIDYDPEVTYGIDGITRYRVTIGTWALSGVLSMSASQQPLPDLGDGWEVFVDDEPHGTAKRDDSLVWGLGSAFRALEVQIGDRVELAFDAWEEPVIRISKI